VFHPWLNSLPSFRVVRVVLGFLRLADSFVVLRARYAVPSLVPRLVSIVVLSFIASGCHSDIVPVSGRVTLDGQPLPGAIVTFQPVREPSAEPPTATGSVAVTDDQGRYQLRLVDPERPGALVGDHTVTIATAAATSAVAESSDSESSDAERLPESWRDGSQRYTVPAGGASDANFDILTAKSPPSKK
jgi:hypothetical protein